MFHCLNKNYLPLICVCVSVSGLPALKSLYLGEKYGSRTFKSSIFQPKNRQDDIFSTLIFLSFMHLVGCVIKNKTHTLWHPALAV